MGVVPFSENGGFAATNSFLFIPTQSSDQGSIYVGIFDITDFDDDQDGSTYFYRAEDIAPGRVPTVRRVLLLYRDLGIATLTVILRGTNDDGSLITVTKTEKIGTTNATGLILQRFVDITLTASRPQLGYSRAPNGGPVSIISATIFGEVEEASL